MSKNEFVKIIINIINTKKVTATYFCCDFFISIILNNKVPLMQTVNQLYQSVLEKKLVLLFLLSWQDNNWCSGFREEVI